MVRIMSPGSTLKKRTPLVKPVETIESISKELPKPMQRPLPPKKTAPTAPKEVKTVEPKKEAPVKRQANPSKEAQEPAPPATSDSEGSEPRLTYQKPEGAKTPVGQMTLSQLKTMEYNAQKALFKTLNTGVPVEEFVTLRRKDDLPKGMVMRLAEAQQRKIVGNKRPAKDAYYCPYCVNYMPFHAHSFTGYDKCTGCGISTMDFYTRADNNLFNRE